MGDPKQYWKENVGLVVKLLSIWFIVSFGMGILFIDYLNEFQFFGFPFGFWMAQQGSIYVFVALIFFYVVKMNVLDKKFGVQENDDDILVNSVKKDKR